MKKKTIIGAIVMVLAVLAAIPLGARRTMDRLYDKAKESYYYDSTGYAIYQGLEDRQAAAANLVTLGYRYADQSEELAGSVRLLEDQIAQAKRYTYDVDRLSDAVNADSIMGATARHVVTLLETVTLSQKDAKYPSQLLADLDSEYDKLSRSSYNDDAREYNAKLEQLPVKWLVPVAGIRTMAVFTRA